MSLAIVQDYLRTQGLRLSPDAVQMGYLTAQTVMNMGKAEIDRSVLWYTHDEAVLADYIEQNEAHEAVLKKMFMALDSMLDKVGRVQSAVIYGVLPEQQLALRLVQQGQVIEQKLLIDESTVNHYLVSRTAQNGWLNWVEDVAHWLAQGEIVGEHHRRCQSQMTLPIHLSNGKVLGVLHLEAAERAAWDAEAQAAWVGLALALVEPLQTLFHITEETEADYV